MKKGFMNSILFASCITVAAQSLNAEEQAAALGAHVHGVSELMIAMEGEMLEIQFISPAMNLVGFEHKAHTFAEVAAVERAHSQLNKHGSLFLFSDDRCHQLSTKVDLSTLIDADHQSKTEHDSESHHEITANYQYRCDLQSTLPTITVALFDSFADIQKIHVIWITQTQQSKVTLTPNNRIIELR